jgi:hypothetical protein
MLIVLFILIAGLWAAFLLPSFFDHRNQTPKSTTRDFARTKQLLAAVSASDPDGEAYVRKHAQVRRTRVLIGLGIAAAVTLGVATWTGSVPWLWATIAIDLAIAIYVTVLLTLKQQRLVPRAQVVPITHLAPAGQQAEQEPVVADQPAESFSESQTVRVIAG